jgi:hypothetical protein
MNRRVPQNVQNFLINWGNVSFSMEMATQFTQIATVWGFRPMLAHVLSCLKHITFMLHTHYFICQLSDNISFPLFYAINVAHSSNLYKRGAVLAGSEKW